MWVADQRSSKNRPTGTTETHTIKVTKDITRLWYMNDVVTAIIAQWPAGYGKDITINQDNTPPHPLVENQELLEYFAELAKPENGGWNIKLICQPVTSPDMNILDLGLFRALQSVQQANPANTKDELIAVVRDTFKNFSLEKCKKVWSTLQVVMDAVLHANGNNDYKLPHPGKTQQSDVPAVTSRFASPAPNPSHQSTLLWQHLLSHLSRQYRRHQQSYRPHHLLRM
jgi:hypothetical protein